MNLLAALSAFVSEVMTVVGSVSAVAAFPVVGAVGEVFATYLFANLLAAPVWFGIPRLALHLSGLSRPAFVALLGDGLAVVLTVVVGVLLLGRLMRIPQGRMQ